jgi:hypothetical protein
MMEMSEIIPSLGKEMIQLDATHTKFIRVLYLNMFRASIYPSSGEQCSELPLMMCSTGIAGCGRVELGRQLCAMCAHN